MYCRTDAVGTQSLYFRSEKIEKIHYLTTLSQALPLMTTFITVHIDIYLK